MQEDVAYGILEMTYISGKVTEDNNYENVLKHELPSDWYQIDTKSRIAILNEAIAHELSITETTLYNNHDDVKKTL